MTEADTFDSVERLDTDVEDTQGHATAQHFRTDEPIELQYDDEEVLESLRESGYVTAANVDLDDATHFVAISVDGWQEVNPQQAMMAGLNPKDDGVRSIENEDGPDKVEVQVDEATVFLSNEDGDLGHPIPEANGIEEADTDDAIEEFVEGYL